MKEDKVNTNESEIGLAIGCLVGSFAGIVLKDFTEYKVITFLGLSFLGTLFGNSIYNYLKGEPVTNDYSHELQQQFDIDFVGANSNLALNE
jgi:hypothetical protein